jgi:hypothetical protein
VSRRWQSGAARHGDLQGSQRLRAAHIALMVRLRGASGLTTTVEKLSKWDSVCLPDAYTGLETSEKYAIRRARHTLQSVECLKSVVVDNLVVGGLRHLSPAVIPRQ